MYSIGIYMDQIDDVDFKKDSTVSIMRHLQNKAKVKLKQRKSKAKPKLHQR